MIVSDDGPNEPVAERLASVQTSASGLPATTRVGAGSKGRLGRSDSEVRRAGRPRRLWRETTLAGGSRIAAPRRQRLSPDEAPQRPERTTPFQRPSRFARDDFTRKSFAAALT